MANQPTYQIDYACPTSSRAERLGFGAIGCFFVRLVNGIRDISPGFRDHDAAEEWCKSRGIEYIAHYSKGESQ